MLEQVLQGIIGHHTNVLKKIRVPYLAAFAKENSVHIPTTKPGAKPKKDEYIKGLIAWVRSFSHSFST